MTLERVSYTVKDADTGDSIRTGVCSLADLQHQAKEGEIVIIGTDESLFQKSEERRVRKMRNGLLAESDWTQLPDSPLTLSEKLEWKVYRQALRDLLNDITDWTSVVWPTPPTKGD